MLGRPLTILLLILLILAQGALWFGKGGLSDQRELRSRLKEATTKKLALERKNKELKETLDQARSNPEVIEARARMELGFIRPDEMFIQIIPSAELAAKREAAKREADKKQASSALFVRQ